MFGLRSAVMRFGRGALVAVAATVALTACSSDDGLTYEKKRDYLRKVAVRGAETHALIAASEGNPDKGRCEKAHAALNNDAPRDIAGVSNEQWQAQVRAFFVDSCMSGKPKELPPVGVPSGSPSPSATPPPVTPANPPTTGPAPADPPPTTGSTPADPPPTTA